MDRRIRVKCTECAASIELRVDQQELLDVKCPRCQHMFTAKVPPLIVEVEPIEVFEVIEETPPVRMTRIVQPAPRPAPAQRPKRVHQIPQPGPSSAYANPTWQAPMPTHQAAPRVSGATHLKAILISTGCILALGMLVMVGIMIRSAVSQIEWSGGGSESTDTTQLASAAPVTSSPAVESPYSTQLPTTSAATTSVSEPSSLSPVGNSLGTETTSVTTSPKPGGDDVTEKVVTLAEQIAQATRDKDNEFIIDRTHPKLIEFAGGRNKMLEILDKALEPMKAKGITIADYKISRDVNIRRQGKDIYVVLPTVLDLNYQGRIMRTDSFLLAISEDAGRTFTFLDGSGAAKNRSMLKRLLPNLPDDFTIPTPSLPREVSP